MTAHTIRSCGFCGGPLTPKPYPRDFCSLACSNKSRTRPEADRFWEKVEPQITGCWLWMAGLTEAGYGQFGTSLGCGRIDSHRWSYLYLIGPIPTHLELDHLCRVRACVNPMHLEAVTSWENNSRSESVSAINLRKTHCLRGHPFSGTNLLIYADGARYCRICEHYRDSKRAPRRKQLR
jgi:hypothetical protein